MKYENLIITTKYVIRFDDSFNIKNEKSSLVLIVVHCSEPMQHYKIAL